MEGNRFELNGQTIPVVQQIGSHMPGGFFIYKAEAPEELIYVNKAVLDIFGCADLDEFKALTGYTFKGMLHPEDYAAVSDSIVDQIDTSEDHMDYVEYRIIRKDGAVRWVDDYGHYTETEAYGGIYYVFISDITEKRERAEAEKRSLIEEVESAAPGLKIHALVDLIRCTILNIDVTEAVASERDMYTLNYLRIVFS